MCEKQNCAADDVRCAARCNCGSRAEATPDADSTPTTKAVECDCESRRKGGNCIHSYTATPMGIQVSALAAEDRTTKEAEFVWGLRGLNHA